MAYWHGFEWKFNSNQCVVMRTCNKETVKWMYNMIRALFRLLCTDLLHVHVVWWRWQLCARSNWSPAYASWCTWIAILTRNILRKQERRVKEKGCRRDFWIAHSCPNCWAFHMSIEWNWWSNEVHWVEEVKPYKALFLLAAKFSYNTNSNKAGVLNCNVCLSFKPPCCKPTALQHVHLHDRICWHIQ